MNKTEDTKLLEGKERIYCDIKIRSRSPSPSSYTISFNY